MLLSLTSNGFYVVSRRDREVDGALRQLLKIATREFGEGVEIQVGVGIQPEHCEKLLPAFLHDQADAEGTGLGLSISHEIITQHHDGTITIDSELGDFPIAAAATDIARSYDVSHSTISRLR